MILIVLTNIHETGKLNMVSKSLKFKIFWDRRRKVLARKCRFFKSAASGCGPSSPPVNTARGNRDIRTRVSVLKLSFFDVSQPHLKSRGRHVLVCAFFGLGFFSCHNRFSDIAPETPCDSSARIFTVIVI